MCFYVFFAMLAGRGSKGGGRGEGKPSPKGVLETTTKGSTDFKWTQYGYAGIPSTHKGFVASGFMAPCCCCFRVDL